MLMDVPPLSTRLSGRIVICRSGQTGWQNWLRQLFDSQEAFVQVVKTYPLHTLLGYESPEKAWHDNPRVEGSIRPDDFRVVPKEEYTNTDSVQASLQNIQDSWDLLKMQKGEVSSEQLRRTVHHLLVNMRCLASSVQQCEAAITAIRNENGGL